MTIQEAIKSEEIMEKHIHNWKKFLNPDETGGFVHCKCKEMRFLDSKEMRKFERLLKRGISGKQIEIKTQ